MRDIIRRASKAMAAQTRKFGNHKVPKHEGRRDEISPSCLCPECRAFYGSYIEPGVENPERVRPTNRAKIVEAVSRVTILRRTDGTREVRVHNN
jgi:hypothetical protein